MYVTMIVSAVGNIGCGCAVGERIRFFGQPGYCPAVRYDHAWRCPGQGQRILVICISCRTNQFPGLFRGQGNNLISRPVLIGRYLSCGGTGRTLS